MTNNIATAYHNRLRTLATQYATMPCETAADAEECAALLMRIDALYLEMFGEIELDKLVSFGVGATNAEFSARILAHLNA